VDECKPLATGQHVEGILASEIASHTCPICYDLMAWGLHSSTFRLNVSAFCGTGGAFRGCLGGD